MLCSSKSPNRDGGASQPKAPVEGNTAIDQASTDPNYREVADSKHYQWTENTNFLQTSDSTLD